MRSTVSTLSGAKSPLKDAVSDAWLPYYIKIFKLKDIKEQKRNFDLQVWRMSNGSAYQCCFCSMYIGPSGILQHFKLHLLPRKRNKAKFYYNLPRFKKLKDEYASCFSRSCGERILMETYDNDDRKQSIRCHLLSHSDKDLDMFGF
jgi:hypothetical protein